MWREAMKGKQIARPYTYAQYQQRWKKNSHMKFKAANLTENGVSERQSKWTDNLENTTIIKQFKSKNSPSFTDRTRKRETKTGQIEIE